MIPDRPLTSRYRSLDASRRALARAAPVVRFGLFSVGVSVFLDQVRPLVSDGQFTWGERRVMGAVGLITLGGFGLAAWVAGKLLRASADLIEVFVDGADAAAQSAYLVEAHVVPGLTRAVAALERIAEGQPAVDPRDRTASAVRKAIDEGRWGRAEMLLRSARPGDPEVPSLRSELARARQAEADDLGARLNAARAAENPDLVIDCRDALTQHLRGEALKDLDRRVVRWLDRLIRARAWPGPVTPDLAALAGRAADSFGDTDEGAALLSLLPDLRRRSGLCPVCASPYQGQADACPDCRGAAAPAPKPRPASGGPIPRGKP